MKMIVAVIRPHRLQEVKAALAEKGILGLTVTDVRGCGRQKGHVERYRGAEYTIDLLPKARLEIVVSEEQLEVAVQAILDSARTGEIGDGKLFVLPVERAARIRTGDADDAAL